MLLYAKKTTPIFHVVYPYVLDRVYRDAYKSVNVMPAATMRVTKEAGETCPAALSGSVKALDDSKPYGKIC